jgi:hypothetical protein
MLEDTCGYLFDIDTVLGIRLCCTILRHSAWSSRAPLISWSVTIYTNCTGVFHSGQTQRRYFRRINTYSIWFAGTTAILNNQDVRRSVWIKWIVILSQSLPLMENILEIQWILGGSFHCCVWSWLRDCDYRDTTFNFEGVIKMDIIEGHQSDETHFFLPPYACTWYLYSTKNHAFEFHSEVLIWNVFAAFLYRNASTSLTFAFLWSFS